MPGTRFYRLLAVFDLALLSLLVFFPRSSRFPGPGSMGVFLNPTGLFNLFFYFAPFFAAAGLLYVGWPTLRKHLSQKKAFTAILVFLSPILAYLVFDRSVFESDSVIYAKLGLKFYNHLLSMPEIYLRIPFFTGSYQPLLPWIGQAFTPISLLFDLPETGFLVLQSIIVFSTLALFFITLQEAFGRREISLAGCLALTSSSIFFKVSAGLWQEPLQLFFLVYLYYVLVKSRYWPAWLTIVSSVSIICLGALTKVNTVYYMIFPFLGSLAFTVIGSRPRIKIGSRTKLFSIVIFLLVVPVAWHWFSVTRGSTLEYVGQALFQKRWGSQSPLPVKIVYWLDVTVRYLYGWPILLVPYFLLLFMALNSKNYCLERPELVLLPFCTIVSTYLVHVLVVNEAMKFIVPLAPSFCLVFCYVLKAADSRVFTFLFILLVGLQWFNTALIGLGVVDEQTYTSKGNLWYAYHPIEYDSNLRRALFERNRRMVRFTCNGLDEPVHILLGLFTPRDSRSLEYHLQFMSISNDFGSCRYSNAAYRYRQNSRGNVSVNGVPVTYYVTIEPEHIKYRENSGNMMGAYLALKSNNVLVKANHGISPIISVYRISRVN